MAHDSAGQDARLGRIAAILGLPVESFSGDAQCDLDGAVQCLMLWRLIKSTEGQRKALDALSDIAETEPSRRDVAFTQPGRKAVPPTV